MEYGEEHDMDLIVFFVRNWNREKTKRISKRNKFSVFPWLTGILCVLDLFHFLDVCEFIVWPFTNLL